MPVSRRARLGCSSGVALIYCRMSGEALSMAQSALPSAATQIDDWVRGRARRLPLRTPAQLLQLQFHWGKPPPAAAPRMMSFMVFDGQQPPAGGGRVAWRRRSARGDVHRDFEAEAEVAGRGGFPGHGRSPVRLNGFRPTGTGPAAVNLLGMHRSSDAGHR